MCCRNLICVPREINDFDLIWFDFWILFNINYDLIHYFSLTRSRNISIPAPAPAKSSSSLGLQLWHQNAGYMDADATPGSLQCHGRPPGPGAAKLATARPGGPAATKRVSFSDPLVSSPLTRAPPRDGPGTVFLPPCRGVLHALDQHHPHRLHRRGIRSNSKFRPRG